VTRIFWSLFSDKNVYRCSAVAEMGDRLATIDMDRKLGAVPLLGGKRGPHVTQCGLGQGLPSYQVASSSIQPFSHNRHGPKFGRLCPLGVELGPHLTQCCPGRGLPSYKVAFRSMQPFGHNNHGLKFGGCAPFFGEGAGSPSSIMWRGLRPTSIPSGILIHAPFGHKKT